MPSDAEPPTVQQGPVLNVELKAYPNKKEDPNKDFDFEVDLSLQPTIFRFDKVYVLCRHSFVEEEIFRANV